MKNRRVNVAVSGTSVLLALLYGCGTPGAPVPPSLQLPRPVSDLRATRVGDTVTIAFTLPDERTDGSRVKRLGTATVVECVEATCQQRTSIHEVSAIEAKPGAAVQFEHPVKVAAGFAHYAVVVNNDRGRAAGISNVATVTRAPAWPEPSGVSADVTEQAVVLHIAPAAGAGEAPNVDASGCTSSADGASKACYSYEVYRAEDGNGDAKKNARPERILSVAPAESLHDSNFEWEQHYTYTLRVVNTATDAAGQKVSFESGAPLSVSVYTKDVFPPTAPTALAAVYSAEGSTPGIDLSWNASPQNDLLGYNVYRAETTDAGGFGAAVKLNGESVKAPAFRDTNIRSGAGYQYQVTAVDLRGNESARSQPVTETVPKPQ